MNAYESKSNDLGVVYKKIRDQYTVYCNERMIKCSLAAHLYKPAGRSSNPGKPKSSNNANRPDPSDFVAVGDVVRFVETTPDSGSIVELLPRKNQLSRRSAAPMTTSHATEQIIAANVDQVVTVFAVAQPAPHWNLLDRYLVTAETAEIPPLICLTKMDLAEDRQELSAIISTYQKIGYRVLPVSSVTGEGLDELRQALQGRLSVFIGKSGVGKSSLLNTIQPGLGLRVNAVSQVHGKGKHTTTHHEIFPLDFGGAVLDSPGMREFGLWEIDRETLAMSFPEMRPFIGQCRFGLNCSHNEEPGCEVRKAALSGLIDVRRYQSFLRLVKE